MLPPHCTVESNPSILHFTGRHTVHGGHACETFIRLHTARAFLDAGEDAVITYFQTWRELSFMKDFYIDITRLKAVTGYEPKYTVETGVQDYVAWLRADNVE